MKTLDGRAKTVCERMDEAKYTIDSRLGSEPAP